MSDGAGGRIEKIKEAMQRLDINGWLLYGKPGGNPIAAKVLGFEGKHLSRPWYWWIPAEGEPAFIVSVIESDRFESLGYPIFGCRSWRELHDILKRELSGESKIAMEYSPSNRIPAVSYVDGGVIELLTGFGLEIVSSGDLLQEVFCRWSDEQLESHKRSARRLEQIVNESYDFILDRCDRKLQVTERDIQSFIMSRFEKSGLKTDFMPIVAFEGNSGNPHYEPPQHRSAALKEGNLILIDLWAREAKRDMPYADITKMSSLGEPMQREADKIFGIVRKARDRGVEFIRSSLAEGRRIRGYEVDSEVRKVIEAAGYGEYFIHRTGHNLGFDSAHGAGANFDDLETHDDREILSQMGFTIEPGIYLEDFGVRSEINIVLEGEKCVVTTDPQAEITLIKSR